MIVDKHLMRFLKVALIIAVVGVLVFLIVKSMSGSKPGPTPVADSDGSGGGWTVYGTQSCGWTKKQLKEMDDKGIPYTYVDCKDEKCEGISGYPTLKNDDGTVKVGYTPM
jgi:hypothetical protein